jgi:predicted metal-dependent enzyme (double-stranded beta helix superfamily)
MIGGPTKDSTLTMTISFPAIRSSTVEAFHADALALIQTHGDGQPVRDAIRDALRELSLQPDILPDAPLMALHDSGSTATILHQGPDGEAALMLLRLPAEAPTPIHNHHTWGVACVVQGRNRYWRWERLDDLSDPDHAEIRLVEVFDHGPGETAAWGDPPQDLHAQQGVDEAAYEFVFFGRNPNLQPRAYFDPESGRVTYGDAMR